MIIRKCISIDKDHVEWLNEKDKSLSKYIRNKIYEDMQNDR